MLPKPSPTVIVTPEELLPIFHDLFSRARLQRWLLQSHLRFQWVILTPLIVLWGFIFQRLNPDHTTDAFVAHLQTGAADTLDRADHRAPISARLRSSSTSAYCQARKRFPLGLLQWALGQTRSMIEETVPYDQRTWHGLVMRFLDGTTFSLAATPDLEQSYGHARNGHGTAYWLTVRSLASFCTATGLLTGYTEGPDTISEQAMVRSVMEQEPARAVSIGDANFGIYLVAQVAHALQQHLIVRMTPSRFYALLRTATVRGPLRSGQSWDVEWNPSPRSQVDSTLSEHAVPGRLIYVRLERNGFRPKERFLFTTLQDATLFPVDAIAQCYDQRWQVEVDYLHLKTTLEMDRITAKSCAMFRKELAAGLLTYNIICAVMAQAAQRQGIAPMRLSFRRCWRRVRVALRPGIPAWVEQEHVWSYLLERLGCCRLPYQPTKVTHEPRKMRYRRPKYPSLRGSRAEARQQVLQEIGFQEAVPPPQTTTPEEPQTTTPEELQTTRKKAA